MRIFFYFARAYPWQSLIVLLRLLLNAVVETLGPVMIGATERESEHSEGTRERKRKQPSALKDVGLEYDGRSVLEGVWSTVVKLRGKTTVVAISHQPGLVGVADRICRIDNQTARRVNASEPAAASAEAVV